MPEGDSIHRLAAKLAPLIGKNVKALSSHGIPDGVAATVVGQPITEVEARGKNLLIRFGDGRFLHVHLRMLGRVSIEKPRSTFWKPRTFPHQLRLEVEGIVVIGNKIPVLRLLPAGAELRDPGLAKLGPDLLLQPATAAAADPATTFDPDECVTRLRALAERSIGDAVLVQRALAGIGNIFKSETLFVERIDPRRLVRDVPDEALHRIVQTASSLMRKNVRPGQRIVRASLAGPRFWVYRRDKRPCLRCKEGVIVRILQGATPGRSTYFCPKCQT